MCYTRVILYYIIYLKWLLIITNGVMLTHNKCDTSRPLDNLVKPFSMSVCDTYHHKHYRKRQGL